METQLVMSDPVKSTKTARLWLWCTKTNCAVVAIGLLVCRSFTWSMTSWKRGHTCQQRSTTTQPSRPSKARPVPGLQLSLRVNAIIQEGALWFAQLVFFFFNSSRIRLFGCREPSPHHQHCPPLSPPPRLSKKFHAARQHRHFWFYSPSSSCCYSTFCFAQGLCYVYVSWIWSLFTFRW